MEYCLWNDWAPPTPETLGPNGPRKDLYRYVGVNFLIGQPHESFILRSVAPTVSQNTNGSTIRWKDGDRPAAIAVRPENLLLSVSEPASVESNRLWARMREFFAGPTVTYLPEWQDQPIKVLAKEGEMTGIPDAGEVWIEWAAEKSIAIPAE